MSPHELRDNVFLYFLDIIRAKHGRGGWGVDPKPRLNECRIIIVAVVCVPFSTRGRRAGFAGYKHDLVFSMIEIIPDDDLVAIPLEGNSRFGNDEMPICFELVGHYIACEHHVVEDVL
jgi:hypothetical protein